MKGITRDFSLKIVTLRFGCLTIDGDDLPHQAIRFETNDLAKAVSAISLRETVEVPTYGMPPFFVTISIPPQPPRPKPPIKFYTPSHMLPQQGPLKNM